MRLNRRNLLVSGTVGLAASAAQAEDAPSRGRAALLGAWKLVDADTVFADGRVAPWNSRPKPYEGMIVYLPQGLMSVQISAARQPRAPKDPELTTAEKAAYFDTYYGYFGRFDVDETASVVTHHITSSLVPSEIGIDYRRHYELSGSVLTLTTLSDPGSARTSYNRLVWRKLP